MIDAPVVSPAIGGASQRRSAKSRKRTALVCIAALAIIAGTGYSVVWQIIGMRHWRQAEAAQERMDFAAARADLEYCLTVWPRSGETHFLLARACRRDGDLDAALAELDVAAQFGWEPEVVAFEYVLIDAQRGSIPLVEQVLNEAILHDHSEIPIIVEALIVGSLNTGRFDSAYDYASRWADAAPDDWRPLYFRGVTIERTGRPGLLQMAIDDFQAALKIDPNCDIARLRLGQAMQKSGQDKDAYDWFLTYLDSHPHDVAGILGLASCQRAFGGGTEASQRIDQWLRDNDPPPNRDYARLLVLRGQLALDVGELEPARKWLLKSADIVPDDSAMLHCLAQVERQLGNTHQADALTRRIARRVGSFRDRGLSAQTAKNSPIEAAKQAASVPVSKSSTSQDLSPAETGAGQASARSDGGYFRDATRGSGLDFTYRNGEEADLYTILETLGGGVALIDYDQDGLLDVFVTGGGHFEPGRDDKEGHAILGYPNRLYHNLGGFRFEDVTAQVGLPTDGALFYSHGASVGDFDRDGWPDLLVTGYGRMALYRNNHGKFVDVTVTAGLDDDRPIHWSTSAAWADFNGDGWPDLVVAHYVDWSMTNNPKCEGYRANQTVDVCSPLQFNPLPPMLFMNRGDGTFSDATEAAGLKDGKGLGMLVADFDGDGQADIYVANDTMENFLYFGRGDGSFDEQGRLSGVAYSESGTADGSMGVDAADYDNSGRLSIFVANYQSEANALYRNLGRRQFQHLSRAAGITAPGLSYVGFGAGFLEIDNDGHEDLLVSNGHVVRHPAPPATLAQRPILLRNPGSKATAKNSLRFDDVTLQGGAYFQSRHRGRGAAFGDLDNDGRVDVVISHCNEPVVVLENQSERGHHWLGIELRPMDNASPVGALVSLEVGGQTRLRAVKGGGSYLSSSDQRLIFGLGDANQPGRLVVRWPSGKSEHWDALAADRHWRLGEGQGATEDQSARSDE